MLERRYDLDETYSEWHRPSSISRYIGMRAARALTYIDADWIEACDDCYKPLLLVEAVRDKGQERKVGRILQELAKAANVPAAIVFYKLSETATFTTPPPRSKTYFDIVSFRVRRIWPLPEMNAEYTPQRWAEKLDAIRLEHIHREKDECARRRREGIAA